jgi:hypothetical protein
MRIISYYRNGLQKLARDRATPSFLFAPSDEEITREMASFEPTLVPSRGIVALSVLSTTQAYSAAGRCHPMPIWQPCRPPSRLHLRHPPRSDAAFGRFGRGLDSSGIAPRSAPRRMHPFHPHSEHHDNGGGWRHVRIAEGAILRRHRH